MIRLYDTICSFWRLDRARRAYALKAVIELAVARLVHALRSTEDIVGSLQSPRARMRQHAAVSDPQLVSWALAAVAPRLPWRADCLVQSMAAMSWLRAAGHSPRFYLGAAESDGSEAFIAHAWVELDGVAMTGDGGGHFEPFATLQATGQRA